MERVRGPPPARFAWGTFAPAPKTPPPSPTFPALTAGSRNLNPSPSHAERVSLQRAATRDDAPRREPPPRLTPWIRPAPARRQYVRPPRMSNINTTPNAPESNLPARTLIGYPDLFRDYGLAR